jgi:hypothetical protein
MACPKDIAFDAAPLKAAMIDAAISAPPTRFPSRTVLPIKFAHDSPLEGAVRCELVSAAGSDSAPYEFLESIKKEGPQPSDALPPFSCNQN